MAQQLTPHPVGTSCEVCLCRSKWKKKIEKKKIKEERKRGVQPSMFQQQDAGTAVVQVLGGLGQVLVDPLAPPSLQVKWLEVL